MAMSVVNLLESSAQAAQIQQVNQTTPDMKVQSMTYNIRTLKGDLKGDKSWDSRKDEVLKVLTGQVNRDGGGTVGASDFVGVQEAETQEQWDFIAQGMEKAGYALVPAGDWKTANGNMLFYKKSEFTLDTTPGKSGKFNITPDEFGARDVVYGHFINNKTGQDIYTFTSHFGVHNTEKDLQDIATQIGKITDDPYAQDKNKPVIFMGDLNDKNKIDGDPSYDHDPAFSWRGLYDSYEKLHGKGTPGSNTTDHAWGPKKSEHREDMIFGGGVDYDSGEANSNDILHYSYRGKDGEMITPSDHYAVVSDLYFKGDQAPNAKTQTHLGVDHSELMKDAEVNPFNAPSSAFEGELF